MRSREGRPLLAGILTLIFLTLNQLHKLISGRYLTELEEELARMKRLIRDFQRSENQSRLDCIRDETGHGSIDADRNVTPLVNHVGFAADQLESGSCVGSHSPGRNTDQSSKSNMHSYDPLAHQKTAAHDRGSFLNSAQPSGSTLDVMLETPPASDAFDWDERADRTSEDRFIDGMASIPSRSSSGGYLGCTFQMLAKSRFWLTGEKALLQVQL